MEKIGSEILELAMNIYDYAERCDSEVINGQKKIKGYIQYDFEEQQGNYWFSFPDAIGGVISKDYEFELYHIKATVYSPKVGWIAKIRIELEGNNIGIFGSFGGYFDMEDRFDKNLIECNYDWFLPALDSMKIILGDIYQKLTKDKLSFSELEYDDTDLSYKEEKRKSVSL